MDEEELLLENAPGDLTSLGELDEAAVLGDDVAPEVSARKESLEDREELDYDEDLEEEDRERTPRSSKFASERVDHHRNSLKLPESLEQSHADQRRKGFQAMQITVNRKTNEVSTALSSQMPSPPKQMRPGPKVLVNPHYRGALKTQQELLSWSSARNTGPVPLAAVSMGPRLPSVVASAPPVLPPPNLPYGAVPSSSADFSKPPPMVPMGTFSAPPPSYLIPYGAQPQQTVAAAAGQWDQMVEGFLRRTAVPSRSSRHYSRSRSRSTSSSSRSRSRSYSSRSSSFSESSRSSRSSRRGTHLRSHRSSSRRSDSRHLRHRSRSHSRYGEHGRGPVEKYGDRPGRFDERRSGSDRRKAGPDQNNQEKTIECAKAIGLDNEYLSKLEEQKKMREEILRKKEERRFQNVQKMDSGAAVSSEEKNNGRSHSTTASARRNETIPERPARSGSGDPAMRNEKRPPRGRPTDEKGNTLRTSNRNGARESNAANSSRNLGKPSGSAGKVVVPLSSRKPADAAASRISNGGIRPSASEQDIRRAQMAHIRATEHRVQASSVQAATTEKPGKKKAYLAVMVTTAHNAPPELERMKIVAATVGPTKKVWVSSDNCVSVIFESHDSAKQFMFKYNGKVIHGVGLRVSLQKVFANLAEL